MSKSPRLAAVRKRYEQALEFFAEEPDSSADQLMVAICLTQLDAYSEAGHFYDLAIWSSLRDRFWHRTSQPNWLVDTYALANRPDLYPQVLEEVEAYKLDPRAQALVALYAYAMVCLLSGKDEEAQDHVPGLLKKPKVKDTFAMGQAIQAIVERDQSAFDEALDNLLKAHRGMAKFGGLRETPEGFLCLPAMSLSKTALERDMEVNADSEYLSMGYLNYLLQLQFGGSGVNAQSP
jgi:tetratricopeptide (TPR) repeat protein